MKRLRRRLGAWLFRLSIRVGWPEIQIADEDGLLIRKNMPGPRDNYGYYSALFYDRAGRERWIEQAQVYRRRRAVVA